MNEEIEGTPFWKLFREYGLLLLQVTAAVCVVCALVGGAFSWGFTAHGWNWAWCWRGFQFAIILLYVFGVPASWAAQSRDREEIHQASRNQSKRLWELRDEVDEWRRIGRHASFQWAVTEMLMSYTRIVREQDRAALALAAHAPEAFDIKATTKYAQRLERYLSAAAKARHKFEEEYVAVQELGFRAPTLAECWAKLDEPSMLARWWGSTRSRQSSRSNKEEERTNEGLW